MPTVRLADDGTVILAEQGANLWRCLIDAGVAIAAPCGGRGTCGKCRVRVVDGAVPVDQNATHQLPLAELDAGWRLACTTPVTADCTISVPDESRQDEIVAAYNDAWHAIEPATGLRWQDVCVPPPSMTDQRSDQQRLRDVLGIDDLKIPVGLLSELPRRLRSASTHRLVLRGHALVAVLPADEVVLGVACDLGTTTIVVALFDLDSGERLGEASMANPQQSYGADVVSRMGQALADPGVRRQLQSQVVGAIQRLIGELCGARGVGATCVARLVVAGNTAMQHLLLGLDVSGMATAPFAPATLTGLRLPASEVGLTIACGAEVLVMPGIAAYVGGDIVAGLLARRCDEAADGPVLFVDIGTNGEIVLAHDGQLTSTATAAGPAFEGAGISCGMRARPGAIDAVRICDGDLHLRTIARAEPVGLCGSGLLEAVATLLDAGCIDETGLLLDDDEVDNLSPALQARYRAHETGNAIALHDQVLLTQRDCRQLQLAKAAIAGGIEVLLARHGITVDALSSVILAGGFGFHLDLAAAQRIGLLPAALRPEQVHAVGNTSLAGARLCLLREDCWCRAERIAISCTAIELSGQGDFEDAYIDAMEFPETV